jgi:DNA polymerase-4
MPLKPDEKIIFHIDMNSYFASCEQQANPFLRGKPIGICEHLGGIIIAPSVEAKKLGIKTACPVWQAKKICPKIILLHTDPEKYRNTTARFLQIFSSYTEKIEKYSIDEAFLDMTDDFKNLENPWQQAEVVAREIKLKMKKYVGEWIRCSIGIASSKLIAKIASELQKPDGLTIIPPEKVETLYQRLKLTDIPGIASRTEKNLNLLGIKTLRNLRDYPQSKLVAHFGIMGYHLHKIGQLQGSWYEDAFGQEEGKDAPIKSMGHSYTLPNSTSESKLALQVLYKLSEMVGKRLRESGLCGNVVHFITSSADGNYFSRQHKINYFTEDGREIFMEASRIFNSAQGNHTFKSQLPKTFRLIGVTVSGLKLSDKQESLFEADRRKSMLIKFLDKINDKYGDFTIARIPAWQAGSLIRDSIGFGRMKEFKVKFKPGK